MHTSLCLLKPRFGKRQYQGEVKTKFIVLKKVLLPYLIVFLAVTHAKAMITQLKLSASQNLQTFQNSVKLTSIGETGSSSTVIIDPIIGELPEGRFLIDRNQTKRSLQ